jgi:hypothetical protein
MRVRSAYTPGARCAERFISTQSGRRPSPRLWIAVLWLFGLVPIWAATNAWFDAGRLMAGGDYFPVTLINPNLWAQRLRYALDDTSPMRPLSDFITNLPEVWLHQILRMALPAAEAQHASYTLLYGAQFVAMIFFALTLFPGRRIAAYVSALFYCFNVGMLIVLPNYVWMFMLAFLPFIAGLLIRIITEPPNRAHMSLFVAASGLSGFLFNNPPTFALFVLFNFLIMAWAIGVKKFRVRDALGRIAVLISFSILANIYWIAQVFFVLFGPDHFTISATTSAQNWSWVAQRSSILNMFWLNGFWAWSPRYFVYSPAYNTPLLEIAVFVPTIIAMSSIMNKHVTKMFVLPATALALALLLLSTGLHGPWQAINNFMFQYVPFYWLFREPDNKFSLLLLILYAPLIGMQVEWLSRWIGGLMPSRSVAIATKTVVLLLATTTFCLTSFPLITGAVVGRGYDHSSKTGISIPGYWYQLAGYLSRHDPHDGVLLLPNDDFYAIPYRWGYYGADVVAKALLPNPVITLNNGASAYLSASSAQGFMDRILQMLERNDRGPLASYLSVLNVRFVVQRNDVVDDQPGRGIIPAQQVHAFLRAQPGIHFVHAFGKLDLYAVDDRYYLPPVYAVPVPRRAVAGPGAERLVNDTLRSALGLRLDRARQGMPLREPAVHVMQLNAVQQNLTRLSIRVGPTAGPIVLVLSALYNVGWHLCIVPDGVAVPPWSCWFGGFVPVASHVHALGFANGWLIDHRGRYTVIMDYGFQHVTDLAALLSAGTVAGAVLAGLLPLGATLSRRIHHWRRAARSHP